jgi:hypothetical protein
MSNIATKKIATIALGLGLSAALLFSFATPAKADTLSTLQAQVQALLAQIAALQGTSSGGTGAACTTFTRDHQMGDSGGEVMAIQKFLNSNGHQVAASGAGSPGNETSTFGGLTKAAVMKFQAAKGITPTAGYWGPKTRAAANAMCVGGGSTGGGGVVVPVGAGLRVTLASDSPLSGTLVQGQGIAELAKFTFTNGGSAPVTVTNVSFNRTGVSTDSAIDNVYLYAGAMRLTDPAGISTSAFNFNDSSGLFTIPAGGSATISVRADIDSAANGQQVGVQLTGVTASSALDASVVLPVSGANHLVSSATIATVDFQTVTPSGGTFAPTNELTVFTSQLQVNTRAVLLKSIQFENRGSSKDADFQNVKLYIKGAQVGGVMSLSNDKVVFDFSSSPVRIETGSAEVKLVADVVGGSGETFDFQVRRSSDIMAIDVELNQPVRGDTASAASANTIEGVGLSVTKSNSSPTDNVAVASTNVLWSKFEFRAAGDNLKIEQLTVTPTASSGSLDNGRIMLDGVQVGSTADIVQGGTTFSLGSSMILTAGKTHVVEIYGDAKTSTSTNIVTGSTVQVGVSVATADTEGMSSGDRLSSAISTVNGNSITVTSSSLTGAKSTGYGNQTMLAGSNNAKIASFTLSTGSNEGVNVNTIVVDMSSANAASTTDLRLVDNATGAQIGSAKSSPSSSNNFGVNLALAKSVTKVIDVYANIKSGSNAGAMVATLDAATGGTGATTGQSITIGSDATLQTITVGSGSLTITRDAGTPVNSNVIAGTNMVQVGKFNFEAANSSYTVQELQVAVPNSVNNSVSNVTLKYKNSAGVEQTMTQALVIGGSTSTASFTGMTFYVPMNDSADVDVYVDIPTITSGASSGAGVYVALSSTGFKSVDSAGTQSTTGTYVQSNSASGYGTKYVKKSIPTIAKTSSGLSNVVAAGTGVYRFTVTGDAAGSVELYKMVFSVATTGTTFAGPQLYDVTGTAVLVGGSSISGTTVVTLFGSDIQEIGAGATKIYELRFTTVTGWDNNDSITVDIEEDTAAAANGTATATLSGNNMVWSDRSATSHASTTADWTNGYLVKDVDNDFRTCTASTSGTSCN